MIADNNTTAIQELLIDGFTEETLRRLLLYAVNSTIRSLLQEMSSSDSLAVMVDKIVVHCQKQDCFDALLSEVRRANPAQHVRFEESLSHLNTGLISETKLQLHDKAKDLLGSQAISSVTIGNVAGGIHHSIITAGSVYETTVDQLVLNVIRSEAGIAEQRHRRDLLELMKRLWVTHQLEESLTAISWIDPLIEIRADAVRCPWNTVVDTKNSAICNIPLGTQIEDIFKMMQRSLLILGSAGSGKTLLVLKLVRRTIAWAEEDPAQPIPVVLDLAWRMKRRRSFTEWVLTAIHDVYHVKVETIRTWLEQHQLMLLVDGLDRIEKTKQREELVKSINEFHQDHGLIPLVVSCRTAAYQELTTQLELSGAICLEAQHRLLAKDGESDAKE